MAIGDGCQGRVEVGEGLDAVDFAGFDQRSDTPPGDATFVVTGEEGIFAIERQFPFILPMSGRFIVSIIDGMPILART